MEEKELARRIEDYLTGKGWEVYKEVEAPARSKIADLYAIKGSPDEPRKAHAIEAKASCSIRVIQQADFWRGLAHSASIAVPWSDSRRQREFVARICSELKLGFYEVSDDSVNETLPPVPKRHGVSFPDLYEQQKDAVAGTDDPADRYTELDRTIERIEETVRKDGPISLNAAVRKTDHHYASDESAASSIKEHLRGDRSEHIRLQWHGQYVLKPEQDPNS